MRVLRAVAAGFLLASASFAGAEAQNTPQAAVERLLRAKHASADWFTPEFLAQVPLEKIDALLAQFGAQAGPFERVELRNGVLYSVFAKGEMKTQVALDAQGRFTGLLFGPLVALIPKGASLDDVLKGLQAAVPGATLGYLVVRGDSELAALAPERPMAVGSAFKLAVLAALRSQIEAETRSWSDVVPLSHDAKSLPSGPYRAWPDEIPLTLATYAAEMISVSDNTAADALIAIVGRDAARALAPRNDPFLTTREMFVLKGKDATLRTAFLQSTPEARRALLARIDGQPLPALTELDLDPSLLAIEWYFTPRELCALMARVQDLSLMTINPGFSAEQWKRLAFKGGSDGGVLNFTVYATANSGRSYCVTATWNDTKAPIDEAAAQNAFATLLDYLSSR